MKTAYLTPAAGDLEITIVRDHNPRVLIQLDTGIPNFTAFSMKLPLVEDNLKAMATLLDEAIEVLLDEVIAFMISLEFDKKVMTAIYAVILDSWNKMSTETDTDESAMPASYDDPNNKSYKCTFKLPQLFINEVQKRVVTAGVIKRIPIERKLELKTLMQLKNHEKDVARTIRQYRNRSLKQQPKPMYMVVYDQLGRPTGTLPLGNNWKNKLLKKVYGASEPQYSDPVTYTNETEMKLQNVVGIPKKVTLGIVEYLPEAFCANDMALYEGVNAVRGRYMVKFPDGRLVKFAERPTISSLKSHNYPVPDSYWRWNLIKDDVTFAPPIEPRGPWADNDWDAETKTSAKRCPSGKKPFFDENSAVGPHKQWSPGTPPLRAYKCPDCGWYHLTSKKPWQNNQERAEQAQNPTLAPPPRTASSKPQDFEGDTIEEQLDDMMVQRCFDEHEKGDGWVVYSRHTGEGYSPEEGIYVKVTFKDGQVEKAESMMSDQENERWQGAGQDTRSGWEGAQSFANSFGD